MAEIGVGESLVLTREATEARERFLSLPRTAALLVFALFALTVDPAKVEDDGVIYFYFMRRLFGADLHAAAYQFGSVFWDAPFYLASQLVATRGELDHVRSAVFSVDIASNVAVVLTLYLGWRILRELDLPRGPAVLLLALFGTPLFFYGAVEPSYKHVVDTLYATGAVFFVLASLRMHARRRDFAAAGLCFGLLLATRYANVALLVGVLVTLLVARRVRAASWILGATVVSAAVIFVIPVIRHIPYEAPVTPSQVSAASYPDFGDGPVALAAPSHRVAMGSAPIIDPVLRRTSLDPLAPVYMLFTLHRGIFVWTPLTAFATLGYILLLRRDGRNRIFLAAVAASSLGLLLIHALWGAQWDGAGSFSQRFLTALFPFFLIGTAEFVRRTRVLGIALLTVCAAWSLWIGLVQWNGYYNESARDSVVQIVQNYTGTNHHGPGLWVHQIRVRVTDRWQSYWRMVA